MHSRNKARLRVVPSFGFQDETELICLQLQQVVSEVGKLTVICGMFPHRSLAHILISMPEGKQVLIYTDGHRLHI